MRCAQCLLTDRIPGSAFDQNGVCVWCRTGHPNYRPHGKEVLSQRLSELVPPRGEVDCVVGISGGKDSSFALWAMKKYFGLRVHAFTYDHDGVVPYARQNAQAVCESLDIPLTVVALDKHVHLSSFRDYFRAWLKKPDLVSAGLTCVACKHLHILGTKLAASLKAPLVVWAECALEDPAFLALRRSNETGKRDNLAKNAAALAQRVAGSPALSKAVAKNLKLTFFGCLAVSPTSSAYLRWRYPSVQHITLFDYWPWNAQEIYKALATDTAWERPQKVENDWHSDCTFHIIKEYMFQSMLGVSYADGFLSNQIRAGMMTRQSALAEVLQTRRRLVDSIPYAIRDVGLGDISDRIDLSCFDLTDESPPALH